MENRTVIINGVSYTCLTDEEYEDLQTVAAYEERKKSKDFKTLNCKMKLELRNWDKGACPFIPIRAVAGPLFSIFV